MGRKPSLRMFCMALPRAVTPPLQQAVLLKRSRGESCGGGQGVVGEQASLVSSRKCWDGGDWFGFLPLILKDLSVTDVDPRTRVDVIQDVEMAIC